MNVPVLADDEFKRLRTLIQSWCGIALEDSKKYLVESRLRDVVIETGCASYGEFYDKARAGDVSLRDRIIDDMTTNETSWFRDGPFWKTVREVIIPEAISVARADGRDRISIWSAACSTGQEPYSIGILLREMERAHELDGYRAESFEILATDISRAAISIAEAGRYDPISMSRGLDPRYRERFFAKSGHVSCLSEDVKKLVRFKRANLLDPFGALGRFDVVFMRNVLIYFSSACKSSILAKAGRALHEEGSVVVGATETPELYFDAFEVFRHDRSTFYRVKEG
ncbi:MAG: protein-glutamate O-methyltransferase CheR [Deltaproteobacteria bacterium]|nr:protein-glutamate O-methyltransferase CheR [Deltaproteobacteria bacterium]